MQIADPDDSAGGMPGASVRWERRHPAGLGQARKIEKGKENS